MKKLFTILSILSISIQTSAQIKAVTEKGDTINVYENGIWEKLNKVKKITDIESTVEATVEVDEFDKSKRILTETWFDFGTTKGKYGTKISGSIIKANDIIMFSITYYGNLGCMAEDRSTMSVKLTNGDIVEFIQISKTDCSSDYPSARFLPMSKDQFNKLTNINQFTDLAADNLELLRQYDWDTIRLRGTEYHTDIIPNKTGKNPNPEQFFRQHLIAIDQK